MGLRNFVGKNGRPGHDRKCLTYRSSLASRREMGGKGTMLKMALGRAAWSPRETTVAAMTAAAGCSGLAPGSRPHSQFLEVRSFTAKKRQSGSLPLTVGFYFI